MKRYGRLSCITIWTRPSIGNQVPGVHKDVGAGKASGSVYADSGLSSFYRRLKSVPEGVKVLGREGHKAFNDRCAPYIKRIYDEMQSNEWWIADNHTFDVMVRDKSGKLHRPYLTAFLDARSGIFTGYYITYNPGSEATLIALRKGILEYGIPDNIYVDNGREFLTFDIGGLGHRKKKPKKWRGNL